MSLKKSESYETNLAFVTQICDSKRRPAAAGRLAGFDVKGVCRSLTKPQAQFELPPGGTKDSTDRPSFAKCMDWAKQAATAAPLEPQPCFRRGPAHLFQQANIRVKKSLPERAVVVV